jgi:hypothetical protein
VLTVSAAEAGAARRRFAWLWDTEVEPQRIVELEWWLWERTGYARSVAVLSAAGVVGLTDNLELALPFEVVWRPETDRTQLEDYGLDLRWRLASADPARAGRIVPLVRLGVRRLIQEDAVRFEGNVVVSFDLARALRAVVDVGATAATDENEVYLTYGAGLTYGLSDELWIGAEAYGEKAFSSSGEEGPMWISAGPNLSFTHGRFWVTAALPIGLHREAPDFLPRIIWATAF